MKHRNKFHNPLTDMSRQFNKLTYGKPIKKFDDVFDKTTGLWTFVQNRYAQGSRIYQMQIDFMYLQKTVKDKGFQTFDIAKLQNFIDDCAVELNA